MTGIGSNLDNFLPNASFDPKSLPEWTWRSPSSPMYRLSAQLHLVAEISTFQNNVSELANPSKNGTGKGEQEKVIGKGCSPITPQSFPGPRWSLHLWFCLNWPHKYEVLRITKFSVSGSWHFHKIRICERDGYQFWSFLVFSRVLALFSVINRSLGPFSVAKWPHAPAGAAWPRNSTWGSPIIPYVRILRIFCGFSAFSGSCQDTVARIAVWDAKWTSSSLWGPSPALIEHIHRCFPRLWLSKRGNASP